MATKYAELLNDEKVRVWYDNVVAGSKITADVHLRTFGLYCHLTGETPD